MNDEELVINFLWRATKIKIMVLFCNAYPKIKSTIVLPGQEATRKR